MTTSVGLIAAAVVGLAWAPIAPAATGAAKFTGSACRPYPRPAEILMPLPKGES
ncbi:MAG TPA: hypothetical protein VD978_27580 [Azospirillum sp.]|nr:hypothetical protein [Azospirillum sp.]